MYGQSSPKTLPEHPVLKSDCKFIEGEFIHAPDCTCDAEEDRVRDSEFNQRGEL